MNSPAYPPISILVPAFNEAAIIEKTLNWLLALDYPHYEIIVINDGSTDATLACLKKSYRLKRMPNPASHTIPTQPVKGLYQSESHPHLWIIDKFNGRKADALNAGLNLSHFPYYCCIDADSYIVPKALKKAILPFLQDPTMEGVGCALRVLSPTQGSAHGRGSGQLSSHWLLAFQSLEYLTAFTLARLGWSFFNSIPLISGAFALYKKETVLDIHGYREAALGDDSDLTLRLHQHLCLDQKRPYKMTFIPEPLCWTQVPADLRSFFNQRVRWQRGVIDGIMASSRLVGNRQHPALGFYTLPYLLAFNFADVMMIGFGLMLLLLSLFFQPFPIEAFFLYLLVTGLYWFWINMTAIFMDILTYQTYRSTPDILKLIALSLSEGLIYFPINLVARAVGIYQHLTRYQKVHGTIQRYALALES